MLLSSAVAMKLDVEALNDLDVVVAKQPAVIQPTEVDVSSADSVLPLPLPSDALLPGGGAQLDSAALLPFDRLPMYSLTHGQVMTEEQLEILRRQISAYATICQQLVELHKAIMVQQTTLTDPSAYSHTAEPFCTRDRQGRTTGKHNDGTKVIKGRIEGTIAANNFLSDD
eukprot:c25757_g1_i1 orf=341-850(-)